MRVRVIGAVAASLCAFLLELAPAAAVAQTSCGDRRPARRSVRRDSTSLTQTADAIRNDDLHHPRFFVRITELDESGNPHQILWQCDTVIARAGADSSAVRYVFDDVNAQVDRDSRILISFDREWIQERNKQFEAEIQMKGEVVSADGRRNIEIPGYSTIGEQTRTASARIRSGSELHAVLGELQSTLNQLEANRSTAEIKSEMAQLPGALREKMAALRDQERDLSDKYRKALAAIPSPRQADADAKSREAQEAFDKASGELSAVQSRIAQVQQTPEYRRTALPAYVRTVRREILEQRGLVEIPLKLLGDTAHTVLLATLARSATRIPEAIVTYGKSIYEQWLPELARADSLYRANGEAGDSSLIERDNFIIERVRSTLETLNNFSPYTPQQLEAISADLTSHLTDTDVLVSQTGAQVGDEILLTITNAPGSTELNRVLRVRIRVAQFGWNQGITDSFLLLKRMGVDRAENVKREKAAQTESTSSEATTSVETPLPVNFTPVAGATLGWTYSARRKDNSHWTKFVRWLRPGFGINVSFPQFGTKVTQFAPSTATAPPTATVTVASSNIDVGVGGVVGLFNNAVVVSYGSNLSTDAPRGYWGIGFSFVKIVRGVTQQANASGEQHE